MKINRIGEKERDQSRPAQNMGPSPGMQNGQLRIEHGATDSGQANEKVPVLSSDQISPVSADGKESLPANHLKLPACCRPLEKVVSESHRQVHYAENESVGPGFFCRKTRT
jgi:hypothetical protein